MNVRAENEREKKYTRKRGKCNKVDINISRHEKSQLTE